MAENFYIANAMTEAVLSSAVSRPAEANVHLRYCGPANLPNRNSKMAAGNL